MKKFAFVIMPFKQEFDDIYHLGIKAACNEAGCYSERVDEQFYEGSMLERIYNQIRCADYIIADMTEKNPNVFFEVGYAFACEKSVILITQNVEDIPFDMKHYFHIVYSRDNIYKLKEVLTDRIDRYQTDLIENYNNIIIPEIWINGVQLSNTEEKNVIIPIHLNERRTNISFDGDFSVSIHNPSDYIEIFPKQKYSFLSVQILFDGEMPNLDIENYVITDNKKIWKVNFEDRLLPLEWDGQTKHFSLGRTEYTKLKSSYKCMALMYLNNRIEYKFQCCFNLIGD